MLKEIELINVYIPLITGIVVFVLTSTYNHWRDRVQEKKEKRIFFESTQGERHFLKLIKGEEISPGKLLIDDDYEKFTKILIENDFKISIHIIRNLGEFPVYELSLKYSLQSTKKIKKYFRSAIMKPGETFIIPLGTIEFPDKIKRKSYSIEYTTSGRERFKIYVLNINHKKYSGLRVEFKYLFGLLIFPINFRLRKGIYNTNFIEF